MAKHIKNNSQLIIIIGLIFLFLYIGKTQFAGTIVTTCENVEPNSFAEFMTVMDEDNGTVNAIEAFTIMEETNLIPLSTYTANSPDLGTLEVILPPANTSCSELMAIVDAQQPGTEYVLLGTRQALLTDGGNMWCNNNNNIALRSPSVTTFSAYYDKFIVCLDQEVTVPSDAYIVTAVTCDAFKGEWLGGECFCDDVRLRVTSPICNLTSSNTTPSAPPYIPPLVTTVRESELQDESTPLDKKIIIGVIVAIVLFLAYWTLERGPKKGLIRKRRRK